MSDRLNELLAGRAALGLSPAEAAELDALLDTQPDTDEESFDRLAAALALSGTPADAPPLPAGLRARVLADAPAHLPAAPKRPRSFARPLAFAASVLLALSAGWLARSLVTTEPTPAPAASAAQRRAALLADAARPGTGVLRAAWRPAGDPAGRAATGDVVWSGPAQEGYMLFRGLAPNDPRREQYQLWVFDAERDERYPVDGGVFDATAGETVVPIRARLPVSRPTLFAVTVERPGGVVVSTRARLPLAARVGG